MEKAIDHEGISFIVPVYKSANTLRELHARIARVCATEKWLAEIVYVNDASPDTSQQVLESLPPGLPFRVVRLRENHGQSHALLCGMIYARYPKCVTLDADLQDAPEIVPLLAGCMKNDTDVVFATREGNYESTGRLFTSFIFKTIVSLFSRGRIPPNAGLFLLIRKSSAGPFFRYLPDKPYLLALIAKFWLKCESFKVRREKNLLGETSYSFSKRMKVARSFFKTLNLQERAGAGALNDWLKNCVAENNDYEM